jgi:hypothetical protein
VLRSASFNSGSAQGFNADSGVFTVQGGALQIAAESIGGDAVAVYDIGDALPGYFELQASLSATKPTGGWKANSYIIFDYQSAQDFKFAGLDLAISKLVMGHRDATGWHVDKQAAVKGGLKTDQPYNVLLAVNGLNATLLINNSLAFSHTYAPRVIDGWSYGLNWGLTGFGSDNSRGTLDNVRVQILPPQLTFQSTEDFEDGAANLFTGETTAGWSVAGGRYQVIPDEAAEISLLDLGVGSLNVASYLELSASIQTAGRAGIIFDRYDDETFKFAAIDATSQQLLIGHHARNGGWAIDAAVSRPINAGTGYVLGVSLKGSTVSVTLDGQVLLGHVFNAATVDGAFGLFARDDAETPTAATFDDVKVKTDDPAFIQTTGSNMRAAEDAPAGTGSTLSVADLDAAASAAMSTWTSTLGDGDPRLAALGGVLISIEDLGGDALAYTEGSTILIDTDAAGHGWFIDRSRPGFGSGMDLRTVMTHEVGNLLGIADGDPRYSVMQPRLDTGVRLAIAPAVDATAPRQPASYAGGSEAAPQAMPLAIDWAAARYGEPSRAETATASSSPVAWLSDFLNHLGKSKAEREPNANIKIAAPASAKVSPEVTRSTRAGR